MTDKHSLHIQRLKKDKKWSARCSCGWRDIGRTEKGAKRAATNHWQKRALKIREPSNPRRIRQDLSVGMLVTDMNDMSRIGRIVRKTLTRIIVEVNYDERVTYDIAHAKFLVKVNIGG